MADNFTGARAWEAEGARVALVTCKLCGVALLLDPADEESPLKLHERWHTNLPKDEAIDA